MKSNSLFQQCLDMLQRDDIKTDLKLLMSPIMETLLFEIRPYRSVVLMILVTLIILSAVNLIMLVYFFRNAPVK